MTDFVGLDLDELPAAIRGFAGARVEVYVVSESDQRMVTLEGRLAAADDASLDLRFEDRDERVPIDLESLTGATLHGDVLTLATGGGSVIVKRVR